MKYTLALLIISNFLFASQIQINDSWVSLNKDANFDIDKQSFCIQKDKTIFSSNINKSVRPASVSKLYTSLWALEKLGKDFRFKTTFYVKDNTLYINGSKDPFFVSENLLTSIGEVQKDFNISRVIFDRNFHFNWSKEISSIKLSLKNILNSNNWSSIFIEEVKSLDDYITKNSYSFVVPYKLNITNIEYQSKVNLETYDQKFTHLSSPLLMHLKQVNVYSNNFYSDSLFDQLGSSKEFHNYLYSKFNINREDTYFFTGSGLGENRTTCSTTLKVLSELKKIANKENFNLFELMSIAGVDSGTLASRFKGILLKKVIAKTGTLRHTSTLAGFLNKDSNISFAIFNHTYNRVKARKLQEKFILSYNELSPLEAFNYKVHNYLPVSKTDIKKETH